MKTTSRDYFVTVHFNGPEDCAWFARQLQEHRDKVSQGSQLQGPGRSILMCALGRSTYAESSMTPGSIARQVRGNTIEVKL